MTPLSFAGPQSAFRWGGVDGKTHYYNRTMVGCAGARSSFFAQHINSKYYHWIPLLHCA
jgi:hypothetical protein